MLKQNKYSIRFKKIIIIHTAVFLVAILAQSLPCFPQEEGHWAEAPLVRVEVGRMVISGVKRVVDSMYRTVISAVVLSYSVNMCFGCRKPGLDSFLGRVNLHVGLERTQSVSQFPRAGWIFFSFFFFRGQ